MAEAKKKVAKAKEAPKKKAAAPAAKAPRKKKEVVHAPAPVLEAKPEAVRAEAPAEIVKPVPVQHVQHKPKKAKIAGPKYHGTGRRKESAAKVWLVPGSGKITVNGKDMAQYFCGRRILEYYVTQPLVVTQLAGKYDVFAEAFGGGVPGQAGAVGLGIARALVMMSPDLKTVLKKQGLLTRDPRMKERKKYGLKRARRAFQYTKR